jgi:hypothetical protein
MIAPLLLFVCGNAFSEEKPLGSGSRPQTEKDTFKIEKLPPIKIDPKAKLESEFLEQHRAWVKRVLVDPLAERIKDQPWSAAAIAFAEKGVRDLVLRYDNEQLNAVAAEGRKVVNAGCKDPLVVYLAKRIGYRVQQDPAAAKKSFENIIKQLLDDKTSSRALLCFVAKDLAEVNMRATRTVSEHVEQIPSWTREALSDGSYKPEDAVVFLRHQIDGQWERPAGLDHAALAKVFRSSELPEWVRLTLSGHAEIRLAWQARGGGYANTVTEEGWKGFNEHLAKAEAELTKAWNLQPDRPEAATLMIGVVMATEPSPSNGVRLWFDRAIAAQFDYLPAYTAVRRAYLPRWNGSLELLLGFGRICRDTQRYDTAVPLQFIHALQDVVDEVGDRKALYAAVPGLAHEVSDLALAIAEKSPGKPRRKEWLSYAAFHAWMGRNYETASKILSSLNGELTPKTVLQIAGYGVTPRGFASDIELHTGNSGDEFDRAEALFEEDDVAGARVAFENVEKQASETVKPMVQSRIELIDFEKAFATGEWVKVTPKPGLFAWTLKEGLWEADPDGTLVSRSAEYHQGLIFYRGRVGPNYELRGEFEVESLENAGRNFGVATGYRDPDGVGVKFLTYQEGKGHSVGVVFPLKGGLPSRPNEKPIEFKPRNQFLLHVENGETSYELNGALLFPKEQAPPQMVEFENSNFGFTGAMLRPGNITRVRNIEVRRLP